MHLLIVTHVAHHHRGCWHLQHCGTHASICESTIQLQHTPTCPCKVWQHMHAHAKLHPGRPARGQLACPQSAVLPGWITSCDRGSSGQYGSGPVWS